MVRPLPAWGQGKSYAVVEPATNFAAIGAAHSIATVRHQVATVATVSGQLIRLVRTSVIDLQRDHAIALDFAADGSTPEEHPLQVTLAPGDHGRNQSGSMFATVTTAAGTHSFGSHQSFDAGSPLSRYQTLPAELRKPGDLFRSRSRSKAICRIAATELEASASGDSGSVYWIATLSSSWAGDARDTRYEIPDLSGVAGFSTTLVLPDGAPIDSSVTRVEFNDGPATGRIVHRAMQQGTLEP